MRKISDKGNFEFNFKSMLSFSKIILLIFLNIITFRISQLGRSI
jgi:hypothetical protein